VPEARLEVAEDIGGPVGLPRLGRSLDGVDVEVVGEGVLLLEGDHRLQRREELVRPRLRLPIPGPQVPGPEVGQGLGEERAHIHVLRVRLPDGAHSVGVGLVEGRSVLGLRVRVAGG
jgi:hypothetical protein